MITMCSCNNDANCNNSNNQFNHFAGTRRDGTADPAKELAVTNTQLLESVKIGQEFHFWGSDNSTTYVKKKSCSGQTKEAAYRVIIQNVSING